MRHKLDLTPSPHPVNNGWLAVCSCGCWRDFASLYDFKGRDAVITALQRRFQAHAGFVAQELPAA